MPAINSAKSGGTKGKPNSKSPKQKQGSGGGISVSLLIVAMVFSMVVTATGLVAFYMFKIQPNQVSVPEGDTGVASGELTSVYVAASDMSPGDPLDGLVKEVQVPSSLKTGDTLAPDVNLGSYKVSRRVIAGSIVRMTDVYDPTMDDAVLESSREVTIPFLEMKNVSPDNFIDIRLKRYLPNNGEIYEDYVVAAKIRIIDISDAGATMVLSESDIVNLNNAYAETGNSEMKSELYVTKYVDPANQPIAKVTYSGAGRNLQSRGDGVYQNNPQTVFPFESNGTTPDYNTGSSGYPEDSDGMNGLDGDSGFDGNPGIDGDSNDKNGGTDGEDSATDSSDFYMGDTEDNTQDTSTSTDIAS